MPAPCSQSGLFVLGAVIGASVVLDQQLAADLLVDARQRVVVAAIAADDARVIAVEPNAIADVVVEIIVLDQDVGRLPELRTRRLPKERRTCDSGLLLAISLCQASAIARTA